MATQLPPGELPDWARQVVSPILANYSIAPDAEGQIVAAVARGIQRQPDPAPRRGIVVSREEMLTRSMIALLDESQSHAEIRGYKRIEEDSVVFALNGLCKKYKWIPWPFC